MSILVGFCLGFSRFHGKSHRSEEFVWKTIGILINFVGKRFDSLISAGNNTNSMNFSRNYHKFCGYYENSMV